MALLRRGSSNEQAWPIFHWVMSAPRQLLGKVMYSVVTLILHRGWVACLIREHKSISCFYRVPFGKPKSQNNACSVFARLAQPFHHFHNIQEHLQVLHIIDHNMRAHVRACTCTHTHTVMHTLELRMPIKRNRNLRTLETLSVSQLLRGRRGVREAKPTLNLERGHSPAFVCKIRANVVFWVLPSPGYLSLRFETQHK